MNDAPMRFDVYMEKFEITEWRDGCVFRTQSLGYDWFDQDMVEANKPGQTNLIYAAASGEVARTQMTIRVAKRYEPTVVWVEDLDKDK